MERNEEHLKSRKGSIVLALAGLALSTGGVLLQEPLLSLSLNNGPNKITSVFLCMYAYLLNPLTFYLHMLLLFILHIKPHAGSDEAHLPVFLMKNLQRAAHTVSVVTLLFATPLWVQAAAVTEESIGFTIGAMLVFVTSVTVLVSAFQKLLISYNHTSGGFVPGLFAICIATACVISFELLFSFPNPNQIGTPIHTTLHFLFLFAIFAIFMLGITLLTLWISAPAEGHLTAIQAKHLAMVALSVAFATLFVGVYTKVFVAVADMAPRGRC